jgi:hypothetical protein
MLNLKKTKIMTTRTLKEFILEETEMEINCYTFLGSIIIRDGYDYKEVDRRLAIGRMVTTKLEQITKDQEVKVTKIKIAETVFPAVTYGSESWTVRKKERKMMPLSYGHGEQFYEFRGQGRERNFQLWRKLNSKGH